MPINPTNKGGGDPAAPRSPKKVHTRREVGGAFEREHALEVDHPDVLLRTHERERT